MHSRTNTRSLLGFIGALSMLAAIGCSADVRSQPVTASDEALSNTPDLVIPTALAVPTGSRFAFRWHAEGVQIYICTATSPGVYAWVFKAPDANLYSHGDLVGAHFAGPTWEALDGSTVVGVKLAAATVDPTAIPWLLLQGTSHTGSGRMSDVSFVQRIGTNGGLAPTTVCDANDVGAAANVPYTATYLFSQPVH